MLDETARPRIEGQVIPTLPAEWLEVGTEMLQPLTEQDYGLRDFAISEPNGNLLRIGSPIGPE